MPLEEKTTIEEGDSKKQGLPILRTFKSDSSEYIKKEGISMVDVAAAEAKKSFRSFADPLPISSLFTKRNIILAVVVLILIGAGIGGLAISSKKEKISPAVSLPKPVLVADFEKEATLPTLLSVIKEPVKEDKLLYIAVVSGDGQAKRLATTKELLDGFGIVFPGNTADIFEGSFMLNVYNKPSLIFKIKSYEKTFISIMKWEETMANDLENILNIKNPATLINSFSDKEIRNRDARVLSDQDGNPAVLYSFINREYLVISSGEDAMREIIRRFSLPQYLNQ